MNSKRNTLNIQIFSDEQCRIEAKCGPTNINSSINSNSNTNMNKYNSEDNNKTSMNMITSGSLNFSKTISNLSIQTMRVSKNSLVNSNANTFTINQTEQKDYIFNTHQYNHNHNLYTSNKSEIDIDRVVIEDELNDNFIDNINRLNSQNVSSNSIIYVKDNSKDKKLELSNRSIFYTPSTICNYYQQSNEVTPYKNDSNSNREHKLKLDLNSIKNLQISNNNYDENVTENNENLVSSSRNNIQHFEEISNFLNKKTPIKYTKSQLKSGDKDKDKEKSNNSNLNQSSSSRGRPSPFMNIFKINSKTIDGSLKDIAKEIKKELVLNISELEIEDKLLEDEHNAMKIQTPTPNNFMERLNLNFTFNKMNPAKETKDILEQERDNIDYEILRDEKYENLMNKNSTLEKTTTLIIPKNENFSFDMTNRKFKTKEGKYQSQSQNKEELINKIGNSLLKHNIHPNINALLKKNKSKPENMLTYDGNVKKSNASRGNSASSSSKKTEGEYYITNLNNEQLTLIRRENNNTNPSNSNYTLTTEGKMSDKASPKISTTKKTTQHSSTKSRGSSNQKSISNNQGGNGSNIKQFLLNMMMDGGTKQEPTTKQSGMMNINLNKIVIPPANMNNDRSTIHSNGNSNISNKTVKKSNSISSALGKKKYVDIVKLYSNKSSSSLVSPVFNSNKAAKTPISNYISYSSKGRSVSKGSKCSSKEKNPNTTKTIEVTFNLEQKMTQNYNNKKEGGNMSISNTPNNMIKQSPVNNVNNANSGIIKKINSMSMLSKVKNDFSQYRLNTVATEKSKISSTNLLTRPKANAKVINNFSNYSKIKTNKIENKTQNQNSIMTEYTNTNNTHTNINSNSNTPNYNLNYTNTNNTITSPISNNRTTIYKSNPKQNIHSNFSIKMNTNHNQINQGINSKKQIVSSKITFLTGDDDSVLIEDA